MWHPPHRQNHNGETFHSCGEVAIFFTRVARSFYSGPTDWKRKGEILDMHLASVQSDGSEHRPDNSNTYGNNDNDDDTTLVNDASLHSCADALLRTHPPVTPTIRNYNSPLHRPTVNVATQPCQKSFYDTDAIFDRPPSQSRQIQTQLQLQPQPPCALFEVPYFIRELWLNLKTCKKMLLQSSNHYTGITNAQKGQAHGVNCELSQKKMKQL